MKRLIFILLALITFSASAQYTGIAIPEAKVTVNPDWSITITQDIPAGIPAVNFYRFAYVAGSGNWVTLANVAPPSAGATQVAYTSAPCLLTDSIQYAAGCGVYFVDPQYVQATGFSTTFLRMPCLTFQGTGGCCGGPTGTLCPSDGNCAPAPSPNLKKKKK